MKAWLSTDKQTRWYVCVCIVLYGVMHQAACVSVCEKRCHRVAIFAVALALVAERSKRNEPPLSQQLSHTQLQCSHQQTHSVYRHTTHNTLQVMLSSTHTCTLQHWYCMACTAVCCLEWLSTQRVCFASHSAHAHWRVWHVQRMRCDHMPSHHHIQRSFQRFPAQFNSEVQPFVPRGPLHSHHPAC